MMLNTYVQSLIRTGAALLVGWLLSLPLTHPILVAVGQTDISTADREKWAAGIAAVLTAAYYALVRALEPKFPAMTWLLGSPSQPVSYSATAGTDTKPGAGALPPGTDLNGETPADPTGFMGIGKADGAPAEAAAITFTKET